MNIVKYEIRSCEKDKIYTEILYNIASARVNGERIVYFSCEEGDDMPLAYIEKHLKALRQNKKIDFYVKSCELEDSTEGSYLLNKNPEIVDLVSVNGCSFIVGL